MSVLRRMLMVLRTGTVDARKPCPVCGEDVYADAAICTFCGHAFTGLTQATNWGLKDDDQEAQS